jgi:hypothetical protein
MVEALIFLCSTGTSLDQNEGSNFEIGSKIPAWKKRPSDRRSCIDISVLYTRDAPDIRPDNPAFISGIRPDTRLPCRISGGISGGISGKAG